MFRLLTGVAVVAAMLATNVDALNDALPPAARWQSPPEDVLEVLHAPQLPRVWTAPTGGHLLLADPVIYPQLAELAAPMHKLAGMRVNPVINGIHGQHGATSPRLVQVKGGAEMSLDLPADAEVLGVTWTVDGRRFALAVRHADHMGLWVGTVEGGVTEIEGLALNPLLGTAVRWLPDQRRLLVRRIPERGPPPAPPAIPAGPEILDGAGDSARSTYEARNLLQTAHDDALFEYYATSELLVVDPANGNLTTLGAPALYATADFSPDGRFLLVERLVGPWSHQVPWWRFAREVEVWDENGEPVASIASLPLEYSDPSTAGQVRGSVQRFSRIYGASHLFLQPGDAHLSVRGLLRGRARLGRHRPAGTAALRGPRLPGPGERGARSLGAAPLVRRACEGGPVGGG